MSRTNRETSNSNDSGANGRSSKIARKKEAWAQKRLEYKAISNPECVKKNPVGCPSSYKREYCDVVYPLMAEGASIEEIGLELNCGYSLLYFWMEKHPDFLEAIKKGAELSHGWWMKQGRTQLHSDTFNSTLWYMNMKNRFGWKDKSENNINVTVSDSTDRLENITEVYLLDH